MNETMETFGYPDSLIKEYQHWVVLLRPGQVTLGSLILCSTSDSEKYSALPHDAFAEMKTAIDDIEQCLGDLFSYEKINYMMLMMRDKHVHYHVIPRYGGEQQHLGKTYVDTGWPALPDLASVNDVSSGEFSQLLESIRTIWPA